MGMIKDSYSLPFQQHHTDWHEVIINDIFLVILSNRNINVCADFFAIQALQVTDRNFSPCFHQQLPRSFCYFSFSRS